MLVPCPVIALLGLRLSLNKMSGKSCNGFPGRTPPLLNMVDKQDAD